MEESPQSIPVDKLFRHSFLLLVANQIGSFANLLFHAVMGRMISKVQYGVLASMMGVVLIIGTPMDAIRTALAYYSSRLTADGRRGDIRPLVMRWASSLSSIGLLILLFVLAFRLPLAAFFKLDDATPIVLTGLLLFGSVALPVLTGALQGLQAFVWMSIHQQSWGIVRLVVGASFVVWIAQTAEWGLAGQLTGVVASGILGVVGLVSLLRGEKPTGNALERSHLYFLQSLAVLAAFAVLMNADVVMVKHFFTPEQAGLFARAATIGRMIIFTPMPIAMAMFPKVTSAGAISRRDWTLLFKAVLLAASIIAVAGGAVLVLPRLALLVLYNDRSPDAAMVHLVRCMLLAMSPLGLGYIVMNFELAQHRFRTALTLVPCAIAYVVGVSIWHDSVLEVAGVLAVCGVAALVLLMVGLPWRQRVSPD